MEVNGGKEVDEVKETARARGPAKVRAFSPAVPLDGMIIFHRGDESEFKAQKQR
jgi:hypothetical protein